MYTTDVICILNFILVESQPLSFTCPAQYVNWMHEENITCMNEQHFLPVHTVYHVLYNNQINARALIGQSATVYCASKPMENSCILRIII